MGEAVPMAGVSEHDRYTADPSTEEAGHFSETGHFPCFFQVATTAFLRFRRQRFFVSASPATSPPL
jgi:hypothetical protein